MKRLALILILLTPIASPAGEKPRPIKVDDLFRFKRIADAQISPDGKWVVYQQANVDLKGNKSISHLWLVAADKKSTPARSTNRDALRLVRRSRVRKHDQSTHGSAWHRRKAGTMRVTSHSSNSTM